MALVGATGGGADGSSGEGWTARVGARLPPPKLDPGCRRDWTWTAAARAGRGLSLRGLGCRRPCRTASYQA